MKARAKSKIRLGVNIDHAATLRQVRGGTTQYPDLVEITKTVKKAGAKQITIHLREDRRHIQDHDVTRLTKNRLLEINLEMAATAEMQTIAIKHKPDWVCLVPEKRHELTTEGGLDLLSRKAELKEYIAVLNKKNILVSVFIDPDLEQVAVAADIGAQACEFHTGHWVTAQGAEKTKIWNKLIAAANFAQVNGIIVNAGHGLDYQHAKAIKKLPHLNEVNIGHSIICYALTAGIGPVVKKFIQILK